MNQAWSQKKQQRGMKEMDRKRYTYRLLHLAAKERIAAHQESRTQQVQWSEKGIGTTPLTRLVDSWGYNDQQKGYIRAWSFWTIEGPRATYKVYPFFHRLVCFEACPCCCCWTSYEIATGWIDWGLFLPAVRTGDLAMPLSKRCGNFRLCLVTYDHICCINS